VTSLWRDEALSVLCLKNRPHLTVYWDGMPEFEAMWAKRIQFRVIGIQMLVGKKARTH
jgi:hypothetical protein